MKKQAFMGLLIVGTLHFFAPAVSGQDLFNTLSNRDVKEILEDMDYQDITSTDTSDSVTVFTVTTPNYNFSIYNYRESQDLTLWMYIVNDEGVTRTTLQKVNDWNRDGRWSKAYLDGDGDWVLESDFDIEPGVTEAQVQAWIRLWLATAENYIEYINE